MIAYSVQSTSNGGCIVENHSNEKSPGIQKRVKCVPVFFNGASVLNNMQTPYWFQ